MGRCPFERFVPRKYTVPKACLYKADKDTSGVSDGWLFNLVHRVSLSPPSRARETLGGRETLRNEVTGCFLRAKIFKIEMFCVDEKISYRMAIICPCKWYSKLIKNCTEKSDEKFTALLLHVFSLTLRNTNTSS